MLLEKLGSGHNKQLIRWEGRKMYKLIGENNKVNYGCIDEPIEWNYAEFKLLDFFNKEVYVEYKFPCLVIDLSHAAI
jgi:hypothetical protein